MRNYTLRELEVLTQHVTTILEQWGNPPVAHALVGRLWHLASNGGGRTRRSVAINMPDEEASNVLFVLADDARREEMIRKYDFLGVDSEGVEKLLLSFTPGEVGELSRPLRAARWIYLNKTFWWPHLANGHRGRTAPTDWDALIAALRSATAALRGTIVQHTTTEGFVKGHDEAGRAIILDFTGIEPRKQPHEKLLTTAEQATTLAIIPAYQAKTRMLDIPKSWCATYVGHVEQTVIASNRPFVKERQLSMFPW